MSLRQTQIQFTLLLTNLLIVCIEERKHSGEVNVHNLWDRLAREKIEPFIDQSYTHLEHINAYEQKMVMKREVIADKGIWTAKKRYILNCWDIGRGSIQRT